MGLLLGLVSLAAVARAQSAGHFLPPHSDLGVDLNGDSFFDVLRLEINVTATTPGFFFLVAQLFDATNVTSITSQSTGFNLNGTAVIDLDLDGASIRASGIDGPYQANLVLYNDAFSLIDYNAHVTQSYNYTDFNGIPATFAPPYSDMGVDTNNNSLFDFLEVGARVNVTQAGTYRVEGDLVNSSFGLIDSASATVTLSPGVVTVPLDFTGWTIHASGLDGPYNVSLYLIQPPFTVLDFDRYATGAYAYTDFEAPPATLSPPHSDTGVDSDADGLFNAVAVNVSVNVSEPGAYTVFGRLTDSTMLLSLGFDSATETLSPGPHTMRLEFSTLPMVVAGVDGPYVVTLTLRTQAGDLIGSGSHQTQAYLVSQFDPVPAQFGSPHSDRGIDRDVPPDGTYNVLEVDARINVTDPGVYLVNANLLNSSGAAFIAGDGWQGLLSAGNHSVPLIFPGILIRSSGFDGPYRVNLTLFAALPGSFPVPIDGDLYVTQPYNSTDFQAFTPATLTGVVRDAATTAPLPFASVTAFNYLDSFSLFSVTDASGNYSLNLYTGEWVLAFDDPSHQSRLIRLSLSAATVHNVDLGPQRAPTNTNDLTFTSWDAADVRVRSIGEVDNATFRLMFDWYFGNQDQFLDQQEFDTFIAALGIGLPSLPADTQNMFLVDGIHFDLVPGSNNLTFLNITGPIDSTTPPEYELSGSYVSNVTIPSAISHGIRLRAQYDSDFGTNAYTIHLPSPFELVNFNASSSIAVSGLGTPTALVDPLQDPNPFDPITSEWVDLGTTTPDTTAPSVTGASASPDPAEAGTSVLFSANVTDDRGVRAVSVEVSDGSGAPLGNFTMSFNPATGKFEVSHSFARVGTLSFTVWASDAGGNVASSTGNVVVRDTTPPTMTGTTDSPDPVELGGMVTISTQIGDVVGIDSAKVEIKDPTGAVVGNFTMSHGSGTAYSYQVTPTKVGSYTYQITAADASGNARVVSGSFQVQDTTPPVANAGPDRTVNQGTTVTFDGTGSSDGDGIASYTWTFTDGGSVSLTGPNPTHRFDHAGTYTVTLTVTDPSGNSNTDTVRITVAATSGDVSGTVLGPSGSAISGATVRLLSGTTEVATTSTNVTGQFTFTGVSPGSYTIRVEASGFESKTTSVSVTAGGVAPVSVNLVALSGGGLLGLGIEVWGLLLAVIIVVVVALAFLVRRRRKPPEI